MAYDYNEYMKNYNKEKLVTVSVKLHKENDADIIAALKDKNKSQYIKDCIKKQITKKY